MTAPPWFIPALPVAECEADQTRVAARWSKPHHVAMFPLWPLARSFHAVAWLIAGYLLWPALVVGRAQDITSVSGLQQAVRYARPAGRKLAC